MNENTTKSHHLKEGDVVTLRQGAYALPMTVEKVVPGPTPNEYIAHCVFFNARGEVRHLAIDSRALMRTTYVLAPEKGNAAQGLLDDRKEQVKAWVRHAGRLELKMKETTDHLVALRTSIDGKMLHENESVGLMREVSASITQALETLDLLGSVPPRSKTILIVDDEPTKARAIQRTLARKYPGFSWVHASSFAEARDRMDELEDKTFDFVITDANMPIEGTESSSLAYLFVLKECAARGIPAVVVSGMPAPQNFEGDWVLFDENFGKPLGAALRQALGWPKAPSARRA